MQINIRSYFYKFKNLQAPLEKYIFPVILLFYPLVGVSRGLDLADTTYALGNYEFFEVIDPMWGISTFLANVCGALFMHLPGGSTMMGMNIYCSFVISAAALAAYYVLGKWEPRWMIFIGAFIAESLCWCPRAILYNYLTYLFMTLGILFLFMGLFEWGKQSLDLVLAGVFLGLNVMVRFPNIVEAAFILILWFYELITHAEFKDALKKTLLCIGGYIIGLIVPYAAISLIYGPSAYFDMIGSLFGMTSGASDYTTGGMIASILSAYGTTFMEMLIMLPCMAAGIIMFCYKQDRFILPKKIIYILGLLVLVRYYFATGVFTRNYNYYDCMFQAAMMFVIITLVLGIIGSAGVLNGSRQEQTLAFAVVLIVLITPLGSNNYTYPVINNLFLTAPISLWMLRRLMFRLGEKPWHFVWQSMITTVIIVLLIQGSIFHGSFAFGDGENRDSHSALSKISSMETTAQKAQDLDELATALYDNKCLGVTAVFFGGIPGVAYALDIEPALDTTWPDLDSYSIDKFVTGLEEISGERNLPIIIIGKNPVEYTSFAAKQEELKDFMFENNYRSVFENDSYELFIR